MFDDSFFNSLTPFNFNQKISSPQDEDEPGITFAKHFKLIPDGDSYNCVKTLSCSGQMKKTKCQTTKFKYIYKCNKCFKKISPSNQTWFDRGHLTVIENLSVVLLWCAETNNKNTMEFTTKCKKTIVDKLRNIRNVAINHWLDNRTEPGGRGKEVEIDESKVFKRKANVGRLLSNEEDCVWIVGGIERNSRNCFLELVEKRDKQTLNELIKFWVRPDTLILTDCWNGYLDLRNLGYEHGQVNHTVNFLNPHDKNINTQRIERFWKSVKSNLPKEANGPSKRSYLQEFCFKFKYLHGRKLGSRFKFMVELIASHFRSPLSCQVN